MIIVFCALHQLSWNLFTELFWNFEGNTKSATLEVVYEGGTRHIHTTVGAQFKAPKENPKFLQRYIDQGWLVEQGRSKTRLEEWKNQWDFDTKSLR